MHVHHFSFRHLVRKAAVGAVRTVQFEQFPKFDHPHLQVWMRGRMNRSCRGNHQSQIGHCGAYQPVHEPFVRARFCISALLPPWCSTGTDTPTYTHAHIRTRTQTRQTRQGATTTTATFTNQPIKVYTSNNGSNHESSNRDAAWESRLDSHSPSNPPAPFAQGHGGALCRPARTASFP